MSRRVYDSGFTAGTVSGIQSNGDLPFDRRRQKKLAQIHTEDLDRVFRGGFGQVVPNLPFQRRIDQTVIGIQRRGTDRFAAGGGIVADIGFGDDTLCPYGIGFYRDLEIAFAFPTVDSQYPVSSDTPDALMKVIIHTIDRGFLCRSFGNQDAVRVHFLTELLAERRVIRDGFGNDIQCAL